MSKSDHHIEKVCWQCERFFQSWPSYRERLLITLLISMLALACPPATATPDPQIATPRLAVDNDIASAGFFRLSWETGAERVELQEAIEPAFRNPTTAYTGPDQATVISGKPGGMWYYRIRALSNQRAGPWSEPVAVTVAHHSLFRALLFLTLGIMVFTAIVLVIVRGPGKTE
ncbi:MAG: fibronectin type III domain-containing protein [Thiogranum sp.]